MTDPSRDPLSHIDAGWDEAPESGGGPAPTPPAATSSEIDALDDGWSDVAHVVASAPDRPLVGSSPPADADALDDGWDDEPASSPGSPRRFTAPRTAKSKKARKQLERELKAQRTRTRQQRLQEKKQARREEDRKRHAQRTEQAAPRRDVVVPVRGKSRSDAKRPAAAVPPKEPSAASGSLERTRNAQAAELAPASGSVVNPVVLLWTLLALLVVGSLLWITRRG